jgi:aryl-alcohol dehydrogenase-like predicted oxidoreductase
MKYNLIEGLEKKISRVILGNDKVQKIDEAFKIWDKWIEAGGNAFDCAYIYGGGLQERLLGEYIKSRSLEKEIVIISKAAMNANDFKKVRTFIDESLNRLNKDSLDIFLLHRDFPDVSVKKIIDFLNLEKKRGKIKIFGASNWTLKRFAEANHYAILNKLEPMRILSNNFSLATMEKALWPGCLSSNNKAYIEYMIKNNIHHFSWSSQSRGFFSKKYNYIDRLIYFFTKTEDLRLKYCFYSKNNIKLFDTVNLLAKKKNRSPNALALAWVLQQKFSSHVIIGPKNEIQLKKSLECLEFNLSESDIRLLNQEKQE